MFKRSLILLFAVCISNTVYGIKIHNRTRRDIKILTKDTSCVICPEAEHDSSDKRVRVRIDKTTYTIGVNKTNLFYVEVSENNEGNVQVTYKLIQQEESVDLDDLSDDDFDY